MTLTVVQVDAFTDRPFAGNPAAICLLPSPRPEAWMQSLAREMNLSETAFLVRRRDGFDLRWFTPGGEVDLCGHATLASAHAMWEQGHLAPDEPAVFHTASGVLTAERDGEWIRMDFPAEPPVPAECPGGLADALGAIPRFVGRNRLDHLVLLEDEATLGRLEPDFKALTRLSSRGLIVTAPCATGEFDFVSRYFCPSFGIDEDPVTGSAHCALGPFWADRLGRPGLVGYQASPRGGIVHVEVRGDRVTLSGQAVTVMIGHLCDVALSV